MVSENVTIAHPITQMSIFLLHIGICSQVIPHPVATKHQWICIENSLHIPQNRRLVVAGGDKESTVGTKGSFWHQTSMPRERRQQDAIFVPQFHRVIQTCRSDDFTIRAKGNSHHSLCVTFKRSQEL